MIDTFFFTMSIRNRLINLGSTWPQQNCMIQLFSNIVSSRFSRLPNFTTTSHGVLLGEGPLNLYRHVPSLKLTAKTNPWKWMVGRWSFPFCGGRLGQISGSVAVSSQDCACYILGGGFEHSLFSPLLGEDSHFDEQIFQMGWFSHRILYGLYYKHI